MITDCQNQYASTMIEWEDTYPIKSIETQTLPFWKDTNEQRLVIPPNDSLKRRLMQIWHDGPTASEKINISYYILLHLITSYSSYFGGKKGISGNKTSFFLLMCRPSWPRQNSQTDQPRILLAQRTHLDTGIRQRMRHLSAKQEPDTPTKNATISNPVRTRSQTLFTRCYGPYHRTP